MRIYIIGDDGITLCHEAPATVNDGEIAVASKEELHTAPLSGKRLLGLWNALPGVASIQIMLSRMSKHLRWAAVGIIVLAVIVALWMVKHT